MAGFFAWSLMAGRDPASIGSVVVGRPAPPLDLPALRPGDPPLTDALLRTGKPVIVNFFASWCTPCVGRASAVHAAQRSARARPSSASPGRTSPTRRAPWLKRSWAIPSPMPASTSTARSGLDWGLSGVPETYLVDGDGIVRLHFRGPITERDLNETILPFLKGAVSDRRSSHRHSCSLSAAQLGRGWAHRVRKEREVVKRRPLTAASPLAGERSLGVAVCFPASVRPSCPRRRAVGGVARSCARRACSGDRAGAAAASSARTSRSTILVAEVARDMRRAVRERLVAGDSDSDVFGFMVARYGDYVLLKPPFQGGHARPVARRAAGTADRGRCPADCRAPP